jgi:membrane peptidoglycan carboxypeptidase
MLAGILPNPRAWNPCDDLVQVREARHSVLAKLLEHKQLTQDEFRGAVDAPVVACSSDGSLRPHAR